jgi:hypothetical protein
VAPRNEYRDSSASLGMTFFFEGGDIGRIPISLEIREFDTA